METPSDAAQPTIGPLVRRWRTLRHMSQLDLALRAEVSARHISFIENGRASPSREMILILARVLDVPPRQRNQLLLAAGYAPAYTETPLDAPPMQQVVRALTLLLRQYEPSGAVVMDGRLDIVMVNAAYARVLTLLGVAPMTPYVLLPHPRVNALRLMLAPGPFREAIKNWEVVARVAMERVQRELTLQPDIQRQAVLDNVVAECGLSTAGMNTEEANQLIIPVEISLGPVALRLLSTITTLGTPQDITLRELRIETFHAADEATEQAIRMFAESSV